MDAEGLGRKLLRFLEFPSRVRLGSRHLRLPEHFQNSPPPVRLGTPLSSEVVPERVSQSCCHRIPSSTDPDLLFLAFCISLPFFLPRISSFLSVFSPSFRRILGVRQEQKILVFFFFFSADFPWLFKKKTQDKKIKAWEIAQGRDLKRQRRSCNDLCLVWRAEVSSQRLRKSVPELLIGKGQTSVEKEGAILHAWFSLSP